MYGIIIIMEMYKYMTVLAAFIVLAITFLQPQNTKDAVVEAAGPYQPSIVKTAEKIQRTFSVAFDLFSKCDNIYNKCVVTEE